MKRISLRIEEETAKRLRLKAFELDTSMNEILTQLVSAFLDDEENIPIKKLDTKNEQVRLHNTSTKEKEYKLYSLPQHPKTSGVKTGIKSDLEEIKNYISVEARNSDPVVTVSELEEIYSWGYSLSDVKIALEWLSESDHKRAKFIRDGGYANARTLSKERERFAEYLAWAKNWYNSLAHVRMFQD